jgi:MSHA pilin protein MshD
MWNKSNQGERGVTLVELIVAMVIISVAVAGMIAAFTRSDRASVDPLIHKQLASVAESMMEEILLKPYDPNPTAAAARADFNDIMDFDGLAMTGVTDVNGNPIAGLENYAVAVRIVPVTLADTTTAVAITVTVRRGADVFTLTGWRTDFA